MNTEDDVDGELEEMAHLWDGTERWGLSAHYHHSATLIVTFVGSGPNIQELIALRKLMPELGRVPPQQLKASIGTATEMTVSQVQSSLEAHELLERAKKLDLNIRSEGKSYVGYLPINLDTQMALIIEDDDLSRRASRKMLDAGAPIVSHVEHD